MKKGIINVELGIGFELANFFPFWRHSTVPRTHTLEEERLNLAHQAEYPVNGWLIPRQKYGRKACQKGIVRSLAKLFSSWLLESKIEE